MKEYLATLDDAGFRRGKRQGQPKFVSPSDPAAQWTGALRGAAFFAYANNYLIDVKFGDHHGCRGFARHPAGRGRRIADDDRADRSTALASSQNGSRRTPPMVQRPNLNWLVNEQGIAPHVPVIDKSQREDGTFSREDFIYDEMRNIYIMPGGQNSDDDWHIGQRSGATPVSSRRARLSWLSVQSAMLSEDACSRRIVREVSTKRHVTLHVRWQNPGVRAIAPRSQEGRDAVRAPQAHSAARPIAASRPQRRAV